MIAEMIAMIGRGDVPSEPGCAASARAAHAPGARANLAGGSVDAAVATLVAATSAAGIAASPGRSTGLTGRHAARASK